MLEFLQWLIAGSDRPRRLKLRSWSKYARRNINLDNERRKSWLKKNSRAEKARSEDCTCVRAHCRPMGYFDRVLHVQTSHTSSKSNGAGSRRPNLGTSWLQNLCRIRTTSRFQAALSRAQVTVMFAKIQSGLVPEKVKVLRVPTISMKKYSQT